MENLARGEDETRAPLVGKQEVGSGSGAEPEAPQLTKGRPLQASRPPKEQQQQQAAEREVKMLPRFGGVRARVCVWLKSAVSAAKSLGSQESAGVSGFILVNIHLTATSLQA